MFNMTIGGDLVTSNQQFEVHDPATGELVSLAPECTPSLIDDAMAAANDAFATSWHDDSNLRRHVMYECAAALESAAEEIGWITTREQGMPLQSAIDVVRRAGRTFRRYADLEIPRTVVQDDQDARVEVIRKPIGVIAAIKPWNVPVSMAVNTIAPAFRAGCTVVLKPSPFTPLGTLRLGEVLREVVPPGTLNVVSGSDHVGRWMVEHKTPRGVSFTGSVATGIKVNTLAASDLKRVLLELGGNDAAIILDDVDPADIADRLYWLAFRNCGQICMAIKRVFVPEKMHAEFVEVMTAKARSVRVGNGLVADTQMGPINNAAQYEQFFHLLNEAAAAGATVGSGGQQVDCAGLFLAPTILSDVAEGVRIVDEEQFGPVLPIMPYRTIDEAIDRANSTKYGLGASVWSSCPERADLVAERLEAGTIWINTHGVIGPHQPFAGWKWSGLGAENGMYSIEAFTEPQVIYRPTAGAALPSEFLV